MAALASVVFLWPSLKGCRSATWCTGSRSPPAASAPGGPAGLAYVLAYAAWGAAALPPSMARLTAPPPAPARRADERVRGLGIALLPACAAFAPLMLFVPALTGGVHDGPVIAIASGITLVLLVLRLSDAAGRRCAALRRALTGTPATSLLSGRFVRRPPARG